MAVGLYRSHARSGAGLSAEDLDAYTACFPEPYAVFVIAHPLPGGNINPVIAWRDGAGISTMQDGFLPATEMESPKSAAVAAPAPRAGERSLTANPWLLTLFLLFCVALSATTAVLGVYYYQKLRMAAAERAESPLAIQVEQRSGHLILSWDRNVKPVQLARGGRLSVIDGGYERSVELSANQVRAGRLYYLANSGDVQFRLEVEEPDARSIAESISFLSVSAPPPMANGTEQTGAPAHPTATARPARAEPQFRPAFALPIEGRQARADVATLEAPPSITPAAAQGEIALPERPIRLNPPGAPVPNGSQEPVIAAPIHAPEARADGRFAAPQPIREVSPIIPPGIRTLLHGRVEVQVQVAIDVRGKVTHAAIVREKGGMAALLTDSVLAAAREWVFSPAMANGHVLPSQKVLVFEISGQ